MKVYKFKKETQIASLFLLIFVVIVDYFHPGNWDNQAIEIITKFMILGGIIFPVFVKVSINDDYIESQAILGKKKLFWKEIVEVKNHPFFQTTLKLIPSKESGKKVMNIPFTFLEGNILQDIAAHVDLKKIKNILYVEK